MRIFVPFLFYPIFLCLAFCFPCDLLKIEHAVAENTWSVMVAKNSDTLDILAAKRKRGMVEKMVLGMVMVGKLVAARSKKYSQLDRNFSRDLVKNFVATWPKSILTYLKNLSRHGQKTDRGMIERRKNLKWERDISN